MAQQNKISAGKSTLNKLQNTAFYTKGAYKGDRY